MYRTEEALPGEVEIETQFGTLLAHRDRNDEITLTTGLDPDRVAVDGRRIIAHLRFLHTGACIAEFFDGETGLHSMSAVTDPETRLPDMDAFKEACRIAVEDAYIPSVHSEGEILASQYRKNTLKLLHALSSERTWRDHFDRMKEHDTGQNPYNIVNTHFNVHTVKTRWGSVAIKYAGGKLEVSAGGRSSPLPYQCLVRHKALVIRQRIAIEDTIYCDERGKLCLLNTNDGTPSIQAYDDGTGKPVTDVPFLESLQAEILSKAQALIDTVPGFMEIARSNDLKERAASARIRHLKAREEVEKLARQHARFEARLEEFRQLSSAMAP